VTKLICAYELHQGNIYQFVGDEGTDYLELDTKANGYVQVRSGDMFLVLNRLEGKMNEPFVEIKCFCLSSTGVQGWLYFSRWFASLRLFQHPNT
jgi:hypothetical protein